MSPYQSITLYVKNSLYILEPVVPSEEQTKALIINRTTGDISLEVATKDQAQETLNVYAIFGIISLLSGKYLIVVTGRAAVGRINSHDIYKITETKLLPYSLSNNTLSETQRADESAYLNLLKTSLSTPTCYFSYTYNITHSLQRQSGILETNHQTLWQQADNRFYWNHYLHKDLIESSHRYPELDSFIVPVIHGFIEVRTAAINGIAFTLALISRRSRYRVGTRFFSRGIDDEGNVSNFVETEQMVISGIHQLSYIQTRGSIPIFWSQITNMSYIPMLSIHYADRTAEAFERHFAKQIELYGDQVVVNLINRNGYEAPMGVAFRDRIKELNNPRIEYVHFDFHHECRNMRWDKISVLVDRISAKLDHQGYYHSISTDDLEVEVIKKQHSVTRTNCMDCLDRTNVVQSVLARRALTLQLREISILGPSQQCDEFPDFEFLLRNVWADHADAISIAYSGTRALKTDFTRTGQRTKYGVLVDISNSVVRYFKNNYSDGSRQDAYDLILGKYVVKLNKPSPFRALREIRFKMAFGILSLLVIDVCAGHFILRNPDKPHTFSGFTKIFWVGLFAGCSYLLYHEAPTFLERPRLCPLPEDIFGHPYGPLFINDEASNADVENKKRL